MDDPPITAPKAYLPATAFALLSAGIIAAGWFHQRQQQQQIETRAESELLVIAELKVRQIMSWRAERLQDSRNFASNPYLARELERNTPASTAALTRMVKPWLYYLAGFHEYTNVAILDRQGRLLVTQHNEVNPIHPHAQSLLTAALGSSFPVLGELTLEEETGRVHLDLCASVPSGGRPGARIVGAVIYRVDPGYQLFPILHSWPTTSTTAEALLVRREGDSVLFLNELRHRQETTLTLRIPLSATQSPAVQAALGYEGLFRGVDYRGVPVFAAISPVPGTSWTLVAKIDTDEVMVPARESARSTAIMVAALLAATLVGIALWWRQERAAFLAQKYRHKLERQQLLRRTEEALVASEAKFRAAFHGATLGIILIDAEGRVLEFNRAFREMLGYSDEELQPMKTSDLLHADDLPRSRIHLREMIDGQRDDVIDERRFRRKDGRYAQGLLRASAIRGPSGDFLCAVGVVEDVTQRRIMEAQLVFADRMSSVGTLAAGVAHELNNPLAFVIANLSYALDALAGAAPPLGDVTHALREAREGTERARNIVRDLRLFSRPDEEHREEIVDVRHTLRSSISLAQNEIRHRALLVQDLQDVPLVKASAHRLGQVFLNLLVNAAHAIPEGQALHNEIRVTTRPSEDGRVLIEVADTGSGISPEHLPRIFEPFFTTKPIGEGTGLGLSICHGLVTDLGGEIQVESRLGQGSTFRVLLPASLERSPSIEPIRPPTPPSIRGRILVVDDEPMIGRAVNRVLSPLHAVTYLTSAEIALSQLQQEGRFDLVLCDLMMPNMTGMELHQRLSQSAPKMSRRMVFLTGGAFTKQARDFLERVPNPRLEKPFDPQTLRTVVADLIGQWREQDA